MASLSHTPVNLGIGTQLLELPQEQAAPADGAARHRMPRQPRSGSLLGVTAMAAGLGATSLAAAGSAAAATVAQPPAAAPALSAPDTASDRVLSADPGLALAARIQQQADGQHTTAEESARLAAAQEAEAKRAAQQTEAEAEAERARLGTLTLPTSDYTLTAHFAQSGSHWAHLHTGLDFAAPTGTPVTALGTGRVTSAGWSGAYGYRVIQTLPDSTEIWYCHLSAISAASGEVAPGTVLGKVGATGNVTGPHLHLEVRPDGGAPIDPLSWLQAHGLQP
ncbi:M23 family metallopeptidase [Kitasatospora sp. GP82]|uniref:M23 family metallopeptidase n=1 Tax=Kitasatospora sp. GP82 TaxID=3035089 RepID=UPI002474273C|nr:M23 family metallopeptidase [Kitasatospora sp. GP82]MDH6128991.1 murein DD-endopeptidase MepM/ murein hydrolase activator NlpD [Kitasatospora sp. GP82]